MIFKRSILLLLLLGSLFIAKANIIRSLHSFDFDIEEPDEELAQILNAKYEEKIAHAWNSKSQASNTTTFHSKIYNATITGKLMTSFRNRTLYAYQGFKFADGPRFKPPIANDKLNTDENNNFDAIHIGLKCPQHAYIGEQASGNEDCLYLNVYTPYHPENVTEANLLPVMFFIHGGAFTSGDAALYLPTRLLDHDVILVTIHYRLGAFGFFTLKTEDAPGNIGLYDQLEALRWTEKYIGDFGGDKSKVTIFGESAGSASVNYLMLVKPASGLFRAVIAESGSCLDHWALDEDPGFAAKYNIDYVGCNNTESYEEMLQCMMDVPFYRLVESQDSLVSNDRKSGLLGFRGVAPTIQDFTISKNSTFELILTKRPKQYFIDGDFSKVPFMTGANKDEGSFILGLMYKEFLLPNNLTTNEVYMREQAIQDLLEGLGVIDDTYALAKSLQRLYCPDLDLGTSEYTYTCLTDLMGPLFLKGGSWQGANYHSYYSNQSTFYYSFEFESEDTMLPWLAGNVPFEHGVTHADELMYVFDFPAVMDIQNGQQRTVDIMSKLWTNMAIYQDPTPKDQEADLLKLGVPLWDQYKFEDHHVLVITEEKVFVDKEFSDRWTIRMDEVIAKQEKNDCVGDCAEYKDQRDAFMATMITFIVLFVIGVLAAVYFFFKARR